jgi:ribosomal protein S18 acetylase RimI-like enzyme
LDYNEHSFLKEMSYQAIFIQEGEPSLPNDIINLPQLSKYFENWGRQGDYCLIAEYEGEKIGAIWCRLFDTQNKGFGFVSKDIPELSIAVDKTYRNKGVGSMLLEGFCRHLKKEGFQTISLSVNKSNPAVNLYLRIGFKIIRTNENDHIMIKEL